MGELQVGNTELHGYTGSKAPQSKDTKETGDVFKSFLKDKTDEKQPVDPKTQKEEDTETVKEEMPDEALLEMQLAQMMYGIQKAEMPEETVLIPETETVDEAKGVEMTAEVPLESTVVLEDPEAAVSPKPKDGLQKTLVGKPEGKTEELPSDLQAGPAKTAEAKSEQEPEPTVKASASKEEEKVTDIRQPQKKEASKDINQADGMKAERFEAAGHPENVVHGQTPVSRPVATNREEPVSTETVHVSNPEQITEKLPETMIEKLSAGIREFELQIEPEHLGKIAIKVLYERGQTMISIACTEQKTMDLIGKNARELGNVMERNLGTETTVIVEKKEADYLYQEEQDQGNGRRQSEQERQREESRKNQTDESGQFLQRLRLGLSV